MTRLQHILLASTMVPVLALAPLSGAFAQAPEERRPPGAGQREPGPGREPPAREHTTAPTRPAAVAPPQERAPARPPAAQQERPREAPHQPRAEPAAPAARTPGGAGPAYRSPTYIPSDHPAPPPARAPGAVAPPAPRAPAAIPPHAGEPIPQHPNAAQTRPGTPEKMPTADPRMGNGGNNGGGDRRGGGIGPGGAAAIGAAAGFAGGFLAATGARSLDGIRQDRRETVEDGRTYIREPGRTIVEDGDRSYIVHDENDRFRELGYRIRRQQRGNDFVDIIDRPDGTQILTFTTPDGRMLRRVRRDRDGNEYVLIDNGYGGRVRPIQDDIVVLPPPPLDIPRDRYDVAYQDADEGVIYDTFIAPPLRAPPKRYTLDEIRYSPDIRRYVRSIDINTINFESGSWIVPAAATGKLEALAQGIKRTIARDHNSVFLVEGFTDATGNKTDNLSLSDRRAQSVAAILSKDFGVPPENVTTQGYGQQNLKENTQGPSAANRRVVVQNITPLLAAGGNAQR